ncbi:MAG: hypothetical protein V8T36_12670 [Ruthenibacterium lactatiformans]
MQRFTAGQRGGPKPCKPGPRRALRRGSRKTARPLAGNVSGKLALTCLPRA